MSKLYEFRWLLTLTFILSFLCPSAVDGQTALTDRSKETDALKEFKYRLIGPFRGGRVGAVEGLTNDPQVYFFGATGGGVWKTTDGGASWKNVSDGYFKTGSVGAIDAADSDRNIIYVGMGEETVRGNVSAGDGVYKSSDGGKTWKNVGLTDTQQISRVRIHPRNPDLVYVAALGRLWGNNDERGIFRSRDGGKSWEKILYRNDGAGASDLILDPTNPNTLYAGFWRIGRKPYRMDSGGDGSGLFKSTDGGDTWTELSGNKGWPKGVMGKVCVTVSPINPDRIWAMVEAKEGGLYRSDDAGESWQLVSNNASIRQRPWYFSRIYADTGNTDTVYVLNVQLHKSIDGGRTFSVIRAPHADHHDLWIAPNDPKRMINGNDGGGVVSDNGGNSWTEQDQPTAQFYRVTLDNDFPYNIYGAQQDNSTVRIPSRTDGFAISENDWFAVGGGESGWIAPHPEDSNIVFAGSYDGYLTRYDRRTRQERSVDVYPDNPMGSGAEDTKYRFQWNFPILFSPHKTDGKYPLYAAANVLFRSVDQGQSWSAISPDLTRDDKSRQKTSGGPISQDNTSIEYYDTIFTVDESPVRSGVIWTGSDDGLVYLTRDNGGTWDNVTPRDLPEWTQINEIRASPFESGAAYLAATSYKNDDQRPYLYKTADFGKSWQKIVNGIPTDQFARVIIEDPNKRDFLYAGTERGIYYSADGGGNWLSLQLNLPVVPVTDLEIQKREMDLVVATQGRSFYVLDDLNVLYDLAAAQKTDQYLFKPENVYRTAGAGAGLPDTATAGQNPPGGIVTNYYLTEKPSKEIALEFLDSAGKVLRTFTKKPDAEKPETEGLATGAEPPLPAEAGLNRFVWNMRMPNAVGFPGLIMWGGSLSGPKVVPGDYRVRLKIDGRAVSEQSFSVRGDPRLGDVQAALVKQFALHSEIIQKLTDTHNAVIEIRDTRQQLENISRRLKSPDQKELIEMAKAIGKKLTEIEEQLVQTKIKSSQDALNYPIRLNNKLAALGSTVGASDDAPTSQAYVVFNDLKARIDAELAKLAAVKSGDLAEFNKQYSAKGLPAIAPQK